MAVAAPSHAMAQEGRFSPTLSDAGMILPADFDRSTSPAPFIERPPSPPKLYSQSNTSRTNLSSTVQSRRRASPQTKSPSLSAKSSRSTLRNAAASEPAHGNMTLCDGALASSPTLQNARGKHSPSSWNKHDQGRLSPAASSVLSEDFEHWPGFDSHEDFEDSAVDLEEQEKRSHLATDTDLGDDMGSERWPDERNSGSDEDDGPYSSAALSRRAEIILANAKKRLNVMEGNLRGARESLVVSPTSFNSKGDLSQHISASRERDRLLYAGMGPIPPRMSPYRQSLLSPSGSPAHTRGLSETSVPLPFSPSFLTRSTSNKRASSAFGHTSGPWSAGNYGQGRFPIKESRSVDHLRDSRTARNNTEREQAVRSASRNSRSPSALETLPEDGDDAKVVHRSASAASGLRDQMNDLKGRISSLKLKAQEDHLRRRSMQSLRAPSPFTSADTWYSGSSTYQSDTPVAANAGLGITTEPSPREALFKNETDRPLTVNTTTSQKYGEKLANYDVKDGYHAASGHTYPTRPYDQMQKEILNDSEASEGEDDGDETDDGDFVSVAGDETDVGPDSVYEDAVYEMPVTERHEDRVDAFDYETFFLHSAMGTYSLEDRRSSTSSASSTATTRPVTAVQTTNAMNTSEKRISYHQRNPSVDSVSTMATFATAAEEHSDDENENEPMDQFAQQILSTQNRTLSSRPSTSLRSDSAINMRRGNGSSPTQTTISHGSSSPGDLASGLQTSKIFSILTESARDEPRLALSEEETQLIYGLAASMRQVCSNLQNTYGEAYERKAWRRRLDEARRILNGEDVEDDQSF